MAKTVSKRKNRKPAKKRRKRSAKKKPAPKKPLLTLPPGFEPGHPNPIHPMVAALHIPGSFDPGHGGAGRRMAKKKK